jgi:hypothetical protein
MKTYEYRQAGTLEPLETFHGDDMSRQDQYVTVWNDGSIVVTIALEPGYLVAEAKQEQRFFDPRVPQAWDR